MSEPFIAEVRIWACNFAPRGWAACNGQLLPIAQNTALFSLVGTTYGGDGRTTLGLPNLQDRVPMHPGRGPGLTARRLGEVGGAPTVTLTEAQMGSHNHHAMTFGGQGSSNVPSSATVVAQGQGRGAAIFAAGNSPGIGEFKELADAPGNSGPHTNMQPSQQLLICIALVGLYPSRS